jgi:hypothetical protein
MQVPEKLAQIGAQSETQPVDLQGKRVKPGRSRKPLGAFGSLVGSNPTPSASQRTAWKQANFYSANPQRRVSVWPPKFSSHWRKLAQRADSLPARAVLRVHRTTTKSSSCGGARWAETGAPHGSAPSLRAKCAPVLRGEPAGGKLRYRLILGTRPPRIAPPLRGSCSERTSWLGGRRLLHDAELLEHGRHVEVVAVLGNPITLDAEDLACGDLDPLVRGGQLTIGCLQRS